MQMTIVAESSGHRFPSGMSVKEPRRAPNGIGDAGRTFRLWSLSEMRVDAGDFRLPETLPDFDAMLVAGGVRPGAAAAVRWLGEALDGRQLDRPVVLVPGPVELSDGVPVDEAVADARRIGSGFGIDVLSDGATRLDGGRHPGLVIVGATLWPDLAVAELGSKGQARRHARRRWTAIRGIVSSEGRPLQPHDLAGAHARSVAFVEDVLAAVASGDGGSECRRGHPLAAGIRGGDKVVVVTAFPPTRTGLPSGMARPLRDPWAAAWQASALDPLFDRLDAPALWAFGRVPFAFDLRLGRTRLVANPTGPATAGFDPARIVEV